MTRYAVPGLVEVEVEVRPWVGWAAYRSGQRLPQGPPGHRFKVRRAPDGEWTRRTLHSLVWHAGRSGAWTHTGLEIPGLWNYRLDGEPGDWIVRTYARRSTVMPGGRVALVPHPVDQRPCLNVVADWGEAMSMQLSRVVLIAHKGWPPTPEAKHCRHLDGDPFNDHPENLAWGTVSENAQDRQAHGRTRGITPGGKPRRPDEEAAA